MSKSLKVLNLFSGEKSVASVLTNLGFRVLTLDINPDTKPDIVGDVLDYPIQDLISKGPFDFIWASPPCECFSVASIGHHWEERTRSPKTERAREALLILKQTLQVIEKIRPRFWIIENPTGMMRKFIPYWYRRYQVTYCQYGDTRMKPTDLWGGFPPGFKPKSCTVGARCHEPAPRGSRTGTQGLKTYYERSKVPERLVSEIANAVLQAPIKSNYSDFLPDKIRRKGLIYD